MDGEGKECARARDLVQAPKRVAVAETRRKGAGIGARSAGHVLAERIDGEDAEDAHDNDGGLTVTARVVMKPARPGGCSAWRWCRGRRR